MNDLHMHSRYSDDGEFTPEELVRQCAETGIKVMSIADHNSLRSTEEAMCAAEKEGIRYIPGVEIDCTLSGSNFHVLGYGIDYRSPDFEAIENNVTDQAAEASLKMLKLTQELGFDVTEEEMKSIGEDSMNQDSWTGEMFAEVLLGKTDYQEEPRFVPYREGGSRSDNPYVNFYWDYYSQGKPCYVEIRFPEMKDVIETIHRNGGKAVLAHPGQNLKNKEYLLDTIINLGIDGIKAFSSYHTPEQAQHYYKMAKDNKLIVTTGSDYHGKTKPAIGIGQHGSTMTEEETKIEIEKLIKK